MRNTLTTDSDGPRPRTRERGSAGGADRTILALIRFGTRRFRFVAAFMAVAFGFVSQSAGVADAARTVLYLDAPSVSGESAARAGEVSEAYAASGSPAATETLAWLALPSSRGGGVDPATLPDGMREAFASVTAPKPSPSVMAAAALAAGDTMLAQLEGVEEPEAAEEFARATSVRPLLGDGNSGGDDAGEGTGGGAKEAGADSPEYMPEEAPTSTQPTLDDTGAPEYEPPELASVPEPSEGNETEEPGGAELVVEQPESETETTGPGVGEGVELASVPSETVPTEEPASDEDTPEEPMSEEYGASGPLGDTGPTSATSYEEVQPEAQPEFEPSAESSEPFEEVALVPTPSEETIESARQSPVAPAEAAPVEDALVEPAEPNPVESVPMEEVPAEPVYESTPPSTEPALEQPQTSPEAALALPTSADTGPTGGEGGEGEIALAPSPAPTDDTGEQTEGATTAPYPAAMDEETVWRTTQSTRNMESSVPTAGGEQAPSGSDDGGEASGEVALTGDAAPLSDEEPSGASEQSTAPEARYEIVVGETEGDATPALEGSSGSTPDGAPPRSQAPQEVPDPAPTGNGGKDGAPQADIPEATAHEGNEALAPESRDAPGFTQTAPAVPADDTTTREEKNPGKTRDIPAPAQPGVEARTPPAGRPGAETREDRQAQEREQRRAAAQQAPTGPYQDVTVEQQGGETEVVQEQQAIEDHQSASQFGSGERVEAIAARIERRIARQEAITLERQQIASEKAAIEQQAVMKQQAAFTRQTAETGTRTPTGYAQPATSNVPQAAPEWIQRTYVESAPQAVPRQIQPTDYTTAAGLPQTQPQLAQPAQQVDYSATSGATPQPHPPSAAPIEGVAAGAGGTQPAATTRQQAIESVSNKTTEVSR